MKKNLSPVFIYSLSFALVFSGCIQNNSFKRTSEASSVSDKAPAKGGHLVYYCPKTMIRDKDYDVNAVVSLVSNPDSLKKWLKKMIAREADIRLEDIQPEDIDTANICVFKKVRVTLLDPANAFKIQQIHDSAEQMVDSTYNNKWHWVVSPVTNNSSARLILKTQAEYPNGTMRDFVEKDFNIEIQIEDSSIIRTSWLYLLDHPEYFLSVILIPLIGFLGNRLFRKKNKSGDG